MSKKMPFSVILFCTEYLNKLTKPYSLQKIKFLVYKTPLLLIWKTIDLILRYIVNKNISLLNI